MNTHDEYPFVLFLRIGSTEIRTQFNGINVRYATHIPKTLNRVSLTSKNRFVKSSFHGRLKAD